MMNYVAMDHLTGLYNRKIISKIEKNDETQNYSVISVDIDHFKAINDTYGHYAGDVVIKSIAEIIQGEFKGKIDFCVRMGGEEFNIYMSCKNNVSKELLLRKSEHLLERIRETVIISEGNVLNVTASIGCVFFDDVQNFNERQKKADECLYTSKKTGRNKVTVYEK